MGGLMVLGAVLVYWSLRGVSFSDALNVIQKLRGWQIATLITLNLVIIILLSARWWRILKGLDYPVRFADLVMYRMAAFGVNYFTPGPQFGGEPLQVLLLHHNQDIPLPASVTSVSLDKLLEIAINLGILVWGLAYILFGRRVEGMIQIPAFGIVLAMLMIPVLYLYFLWNNRLVINSMINRLPSNLKARSSIQRVKEFVYASESIASSFCRQQPFAFTQAAMITLLAWALMFVEFWLSLTFLGIHITPGQGFAVMTVARLAFLTPIPGGFGVLEAGIISSLRVLGYPEEFGAVLIVLIRTRDIMLALVGLALTARYLNSMAVDSFNNMERHDMINHSDSHKNL